MKQPIHGPNGSPEILEDDRRKCKRVPLSFPIRVSGIDFKGRRFSDLAVTTDVSDNGCRFDLLREVERGDVLTIQIVDRRSGKPSDAKSSQFKVAWVAPSERGWSVGITLLQPENVWHVSFPKSKTVLTPSK